MAYIKGQSSIEQYEDANGDPLVNGTIEFYIHGTSTPQNVYKDSSGTVLGTSVTLNALGQPQDSGGTETDIFYDDTVDYKIIRKDSAGTQIDPVIGPFRAVSGAISATTVQNSSSVYGVNNGSTTNAHAIDFDPAITALAAGQKLHYLSPFANTGAVTLDVNGVGPADVVWPDDSALVTGDIPASAMIEVSYTGSKFHLISVTGKASATQAGPVELATNAEADTGTDTVRAITPANLAYILDGTGGTNQVETAAIADDAVTTAKINDGDVTQAKHATGLKHVTLIEEITASASSSIDFTTGVTGYDYHFIVYDGVNTTSGSAVVLYLRTGNGGAFDAAADYDWRKDSNGTHTTGANAGQIEIGLIDNSTNEQTSGVVEIMGADSAGYTHFLAHHLGGTNQNDMTEVMGVRDEALAHDRFQLLPDTGTLASGTFRLYGVAT